MIPSLFLSLSSLNVSSEFLSHCIKQIQSTIGWKRDKYIILGPIFPSLFILRHFIPWILSLRWRSLQQERWGENWWVKHTTGLNVRERGKEISCHSIRSFLLISFWRERERDVPSFWKEEPKCKFIQTLFPSSFIQVLLSTALFNRFSFFPSVSSYMFSSLSLSVDIYPFSISF